MSTFTIRISSSAVNAAGTGFGQRTDQLDPSFFDLTVSGSTDPNAPNGVYDAYCLNPFAIIRVSPTTYSATGASGGNTFGWSGAGVADGATSPNLTQTAVDQINWLLAQRFTSDAKYAGQYNFGEVQYAIWKTLGYSDAQLASQVSNGFLTDNARQVVSVADANQIVSAAQAAIASGQGQLPVDAFFSALIDPAGNIQPLIAQRQSGKIGNFVFLDSDADGIQDAGEAGINNVIVELYDATTGLKIASTVTGDDFSTAAIEAGYYQFAGLRAGDYQVKFIAPTFDFTVKDSTAAGATDSNDSDVNAINGFSDLIRLAARESNQTIDAGLIEKPAAQISGFVYEDVGNDGVRNNEPAIAGVLVTLTGTNDRGETVTATATTDAAGFYQFTNLRPGTYAVTETQPDGFLDGKDTIGTTGGAVADDALSGIVLVAGANSQNNNFGEIRPAVVSGFVYEDSNGDGQRSGDTPISGATVTLTGTDDLGQTVTRTATTGTDGSYSFADLRPGTYTVRETQPAGFVDGRDTAGTNGSAVSANDEIQVTVGPGQSSTENNFGEVRLGSIAGNVFFDANNDGLRAGDGAIAGVDVTLTGTNDLGEAVNVTVQTDATGAYLFSDLRPGTYAVAEAQPAAFLDGRDTAGTIGGVATGSAATNDNITGIVLQSGQASVENNFGEIRPAVVSGFVYEDSNGDGQRSGDAPINGATVTLTGTDDLGQTVTRTATTGTDGSYSFPDLRPGTYTVRETQPAGFVDGRDTAGTNGSAVSANDEIQVTVGPGQSSTENNFGEVRLGSIAGNVFFDANNDGLRSGDGAIAGVDVTLTGTNDLGEAVNVTVQTDATGAYLFSDLRPGSYSVTETQPAGFLDGKDSAGSVGATLAGNDSIAVTLGAGQSSLENNFGELRPALLSGFVYHDANNDGSRAGDAALPGVTVTLRGTNDLGQSVTATAVTDVSGFYKFDHLRPGTYSVTETQPAGFLDGKDTAGSVGAKLAGNDSIAVTLGAGQSSLENNFAEIRPALLSGFVYSDTNNDGSRAGDAAIRGVTVTLTGTNDLGQSVTATAVTDVSGFYKFDHLRPGTYTVTEAQPAGFADGKDTAGTVGARVTGNDTIAVTLAPGQSSLENNFGELQGIGKIAGFVSHDLNNDGLRHGDPAISGVTVHLTGTDVNGNAVTATTTTDGSGYYQFTGLAAGTYVATQVQPAGFIDGKDAAGTVGASVIGNDRIQVVLTPGAMSHENNFGELRPALLSGFVYHDTNNDGSRHGDAAIPGVTVTLRGTNDLGQSVTATAVTDVSGFYKFDHLRPGTYTVTETQPAGFLDGKDTAGSVGATLAGNDSIAVTLGAGQASLENNFGELRPALLSGFLYHDTNNDGSRAGDAALPGVTVTLRGTNDLGQSVTATAVTDVSGFYKFDHLRPGTYTVTETQPAGFLDGKDTAGSVGATLAGNDSIAVTLGAGQASLENNFAEIRPALLSGFVYSDTNNDGSRAGDAAIRGVTVTLTGTNDLGQSVTATAVTDVSGFYKFDHLRPGTYTVTEAQPAGFADGKDTAGTVGARVTGNDTIAVTLAPGQSSLENNFGELQGIDKIAGFVSHDLNNDGLRHGDPAISGVTVHLTGTDVNGNAVTATTTTDGSGYYQFIGLVAGTYVATQVQPAGFIDGKDAAGTVGASVIGNDRIQVVLTPGAMSHENNFGELRPALLSGFVYHDTNNDGSRHGDAALPGVTVTLRGTNDLGQSVTATAVTDVSGFYKFDHLRPGTYTVTETQPAGFLDGKDTAGSVGATLAGNDSIAVTLGAGQSSLENNFGELRPALLSGFVYHDTNNDGSRHGDAALPGVTVTLRGTNDLGQSVTATAVTDVSGFYKFDHLRPGTYTVTETQPAGFLDGKDTAGSVGATLAGNDSIAVTLGAGQSSLENNFGELRPALLSGFVYHDTNNDGSRAGDAALPGVTVTLRGTNDLGQTVTATAVTDVSGFYKFDHLRPGHYTVTETQPAGFLDGKDTAGSVGATLAGNDSIAVTLGAGQSSLENNFGELRPALLSGFVYHDTNNDGSRHGDAAIPGVTVTLRGTNDLGQSVTATAVTDVSGFYKFDHLRPGHYTVTEAQPAGFADGKDTAGTVGARVTGNDTIAVTLASGQSSLENNFGELQAIGKVAGFVSQDLNNDGLRNGDPAISGVTIHLTGTDVSGRAVTATTTTDGSGYYQFTGLVAGTYVVSQVQPTGFTDGRDTAGTVGASVIGNDRIQVVLTSGAMSHENNFFERRPGSIGDRLFIDSDHDGIQDAGEVGLGGVNVVLTNYGRDGILGTGDDTRLTTTTSSTGAYLFSDLDAGKYRIDFGHALAQGFLFTKQDQGTNKDVDSDVNSAGVLENIHLATGEHLNRIDAGVYQTASIGDRIWEDSNGNGIQDSGETGVAGVTVNLRDTVGQWGNVLASTVTDANGHYVFAHLAPGDYVIDVVEWTLPSGFVFTRSNQGANDHVDSDVGTVDLLGNTIPLQFGLMSRTTLTSGEHDRSWDAGVYRPASIGDRIWHDRNGNGIQDSGEAGMAGVTVNLRDTVGQWGNVLASTVTDANGHYVFSHLAPGDYVIDVVEWTLPSGFVFTRSNQGSNDHVDSDVGTVDLLGNNIPLQFGLMSRTTLTSGEHDRSWDAGVFRPGKIAGFVSQDLNNDGFRHGDPAISGVTIHLTGTDASGRAVSATTTTDVSGYYEFTGLVAGTYVVSQVQPTGFTDGRDTAGTVGASIIGNDRIQVVLTEGAMSHENNFFERRSGSIGDRLFIDSDHDGIQDAGEVGLGGVNVVLTNYGRDGILGTGDDTRLTTTTSSTGAYLFSDLDAGKYRIDFGHALAQGFLFTKQDRGTNMDVDSDVNSAGVLENIHLATGEHLSRIDAGVYQTASIGDRIWEDHNGNGIQDGGETGVAGVTVQLRDTVGQWGNVLASTVTDANGHYVFSHLAPGDYVIDVVEWTLPSGFVFTRSNQGANDHVDSDVGTVDLLGNTIPLQFGLMSRTTLTSGEHDRSWDAGVYRPASIGDRIWHDRNGNGIQDSGEAGMAGVTVNLRDTVGQWGNVLASTVTDANGHYVFAHLAPGEYYIDVVEWTLPAGFVFTRSNQGSNDHVDSDVGTVDLLGNTIPLQFGAMGRTTLTSGEHDRSWDAGVFRPGKIAGFVSNDLNNDGQRHGDPAISGVTVHLTGTDVNGNAVAATTTTDGSGYYQFTGLVAGTYVATQVQPAGFDDGRDTAGTVGASVIGNDRIQVVLTEGAMSHENNFFERQPTGKVAGFVSHDLNNDGQRHGDPAISGVTIHLTGTDVNGRAVSATTTTDGSGYYQFTGLVAGTYVASEVQPAGFVDGREAAGTVGSSVIGNDRIQVVLTPGAMSHENNFFNFRLASVGDKVWVDSNHNGIQDSTEGGIGGVTVRLLGASGAVLGTTTTNHAGNYLFRDLLPGTYSLQFDKTNVIYSAGGWSWNMNTWMWGRKDVGSNDAIDSDVTGDGVSRNNVTATAQFTLASGANDMSRDAAITPLVIDLNGDGIHTISRSNAMGTFDLLGNGTAIKSGWITGSDGFLAVDKNGNGSIDNVHELFGGTAKGAGFAALATFDSNADGFVSQADVDFGKLLVWQDLNGDHQSSASELMTLAQAGIASLTLAHTDLQFLDAQGNVHGEASTVTTTSGVTLGMTDVYFNVSAEDAAAAGVALPSLADLLDLGTLDSVVGAGVVATNSVAQFEPATQGGDAGEALRRLAEATRDSSPQAAV